MLVLLNLCWAPDFVEFVIGRFSDFYIAIAYSHSTFENCQQRRMQDFRTLGRGRQPLAFFFKISQKLHGIKKILDRRGTHREHPPGSANGQNFSKTSTPLSIVFHVQLTPHLLWWLTATRIPWFKTNFKHFGTLPYSSKKHFLSVEFLFDWAANCIVSNKIRLNNRVFP